MTTSSCIIGPASLLVIAWTQSAAANAAQNVLAETFIGSTPGGESVRKVLGGLDPKAPCHAIAWEMKLFPSEKAGAAKRYELSASYQIPTPENPNRSMDGPKVALRGTWEIGKGAKAWPDAAVYRIHREQSGRSLTFVKIGEHLLHLLNPDGSLAIGDGGWSYTLNRADHAEMEVEPALAAAAPDMSYPIAPLVTGAEGFAVFEGRTPCHEVSRELNLPQHAGCTKVKWRVILRQDPATSAPTTYTVEGTLFRTAAREGNWSIVRGAAGDQKATVYHLESVGPNAPLLLMKGDDNVLFFLDQRRKWLIGHADFSYTLNRVMKK